MFVTTTGGTNVRCQDITDCTGCLWTSGNSVTLCSFTFMHNSNSIRWSCFNKKGVFENYLPVQIMSVNSS